MGALVALATGATCKSGTGKAASDSALGAPPGFVISLHGTPKTRVFAGRSAFAHAAAADLCDLLSRMTGARFAPEPLPSSPPASGIIVASADKDAVPTSADVPLRNDRSDLEAFRIKPDGARLWLVGHSELGVHHAVFRLLHELGYRWFFQSRAWQIVPHSLTLAYAGAGITDRPAMLHRVESGSPFAAPLNDAKAGRNQQLDENEWRRHNGLAYTLFVDGKPQHVGTTALPLTFEQGAFGSRTPTAASPYNFIYQANQGKVPGFAAGWFEQEPRRYGVPNDRGSNTVDVADAKVRDCFWAWLTHAAPKRPVGIPNFSIEPADGASVISRSPAAQAAGNDSDQLVILANDLLARMSSSPDVPQKYVTMLGGYYHALPPQRQRAQAGLYVGIMPLKQRTVGTFATTASLMKAWHDAGASVALWENYSFSERNILGLGYNQSLDGSSDYVSDSVALPREFAEQAKAGASVAVLETEDNFGRYGLGYYLAARLMWKPDADIAALLDDFFQKAFPDASSDMRRYYELFDPRDRSLLVTRDTLAQATILLQRAGNAAERAHDVGERARIDELKSFIHHNALWWQIYRAPHCGVSSCAAGATACQPRPQCAADALQPSLVRELAEWDYRIRHSYMTSYRHDRIIASFDAPLQFGLAEFKNSTYWERGSAPTHEEVEAAFAKDLRVFAPQPVAQRTWSGDPVAVPFDGPAVASDISNSNKTLTLAVVVRGGHADLRLHSGRSADPSIVASRPAETFPPVRVWLSDVGGKPLTSADGSALSSSLPAQLATNEPEQTVSFEHIPAPAGVAEGADFGVLAHVDAGGYKVLIHAKSDSSLALALDKQPRPLNVPLSPTGSYFYVPKGTTAIHYAYNRGRVSLGTNLISIPLQDHEFVDADNHVYRVNAAPQELVSVRVPRGQDGKLWRIRGLVANQLWFYNVPPYLTASPASMVLPRDLAAADGWLKPAAH